MVSRRFLVIVSIVTTAAAFFLLGSFHERLDASLDMKTLESIAEGLVRAAMNTRN